MTNSPKELQRWREFHQELCSRLLFTPSCAFYFIHMANNKLYKKLNTAAEDLAKCFKYAKYYYLDLDDPGPIPAIPIPEGEHESFISAVKNLLEDSRVRVTKEKSISKIRTAAQNYNQAIASLRGQTFGIYPSLVYPPDCLASFSGSASSKYLDMSIKSRLAAAIKCRACEARKTAALKGEGATFTISNKTVNCFLKGDPISPKLLGIEVGDVVNDSYDFEIDSVGSESFTVEGVGLTEVLSIVSPLSEVEITARGLRSFLAVAQPIPEKEILNSSDLKSTLQTMLDKIVDINSSLVPSNYASLELTLNSGKSVLTERRPRAPDFTKEQRDFAIKTLDLARNRGFDVIEFMLKSYRIREALLLYTDQRSLDSLANDMGSELSTFVVNSRRSL